MTQETTAGAKPQNGHAGISLEEIADTFRQAVNRFKEEHYDISNSEFERVTKQAQEFVRVSNVDFVKTLKALEFSAKAWFYMGRLGEIRRKMFEAIELYNKSIETLETDYAHIALGKIYHRVGKHDTSMEHYRKAIALNAENLKGLKGLLEVMDEQNLTPDKMTAALGQIPGLPEYIRLYMMGIFVMDKLKQTNLDRFKNPETTDVALAAFDQRVDRLRAVEGLFMKAFEKRPPSCGADMEAELKGKSEEARNYLRILKDFKKEKVKHYGARLDVERLESFETHFTWSDGLPMDFAESRYMEMSGLNQKSSTPLYFIGRLYLRELQKTAGKPPGKNDTPKSELLEQAKKFLQKAKSMEDPKGFLMPYIERAFKDLDQAEKAG